jgi:ABC-type sugar transport system substrate-binding protein
MKHFSPLSTAISALLLFLAAAMLFGIGFMAGNHMRSATSVSSKATYPLNYFISVPDSDSPRWDRTRAICDSMREYVWDLEPMVIGPTDNSAQAQLDELETAIDTFGQIQGLVIDPISSSDAKPLIDRAGRCGIPAITYRHDCPASDRIAFVVPETKSAALRAAQAAFSKGSPSGTALIVMGKPDDTLHQSRCSGFKQFITSTGLATDVKIIEGPEDLDQRIGSLLSADNAVKEIFCCDDEATRAAIAAVKRRGTDRDGVVIVGWGETADMSEEIRQGRLAAMVSDRQEYMMHVCITLLYSSSRHWLFRTNQAPRSIPNIPVTIEVPGAIITRENLPAYERELPFSANRDE